MRILVTGSRHWTDKAEIRAALWCTIPTPQDCATTTVVHGAARGADILAAEVAREMGCLTEAHPANWARDGRAAGPIRNAEMVALGADVCLAFPIGESRGTRHCMAVAEQAGIPVVVCEGAA